MRDKALFVLNSFSGGGAERICLHLASELARTMEVDMVTIYDEGDFPLPEGVNHVSLGVVKDAGRFRKLWQLVASRGRFNAFVRGREQTGRYAFVTSHLTASHVLAAVSCIGDRCLYVHHSLPVSVKRHLPGIFSFVLKRLYRGKKLVSVSDGVGGQLARCYGVEMSDVTTINNPVPAATIENGSGQDVPLKRPYLLCVGRLVPSKRFDRMLQVYLRGGFCKEYDLVFLGQGPARQDLEDMVAESGQGDRIHLPGFKENPYPWMRRSSAMVMTSDWEALPTVLVEGILAGARVVSADCDFGPREILTGEYGRFLVAPDDIDGYVDAINGALCSYPQVSNDFARKYDARCIALKYIECYREAFERKVEE